MDSADRKALAKQASGQIGGIYDTDPKNFWGSTVSDWGAKSGIGGLDGGMDISALWGGGGGGGGGGGAKGFSATGFGANAEYVDMRDESMQMLPSERIRQNVYGAQERRGTRQTQNAIRRFRENQTLTGGIGSPAQSWIEAQMEIENRNSQAEQGNQFETDFSLAAGQRRAGGLMNNSQVGTQASIATAANKTNASIATAGNKTQASSVNAGLAGQAAAREQQGRMFALGLWDKNQDRDLERYGLLNDMNMGWQKPVSAKVDTQTGFGKLLSGGASGASAYYSAGGTYGLGGKKPSYPGLYGGEYTSSGMYPGFDPTGRLSSPFGG
jgi:hypothetical protein